jgi:hypothetical protein
VQEQREGASGNPKGTGATQVKLFLSLRLIQIGCRMSQPTMAITSHSSPPVAAPMNTPTPRCLPPTSNRQVGTARQGNPTTPIQRPLDPQHPCTRGITSCRPGQCHQAGSDQGYVPPTPSAPQGTQGLTHCHQSHH